LGLRSLWKNIRGFVVVCSNVIMTISVLVILLSCLLQIVSRYILRMPLSWTEELSRVVFIWLTYWGSAVAVRENQHVSIPIFTDKMSEKTGRIVAICRTLGLVAMCALLFKAGISLLLQNRGMVTPAVRIPMVLYYFPVVAGLLVMLIHFVEQLVVLFRGETGNPCLAGDK
jgi:TRAP-type C4-dicarboxylate transport system permease small subunit